MSDEIRIDKVRARQGLTVPGMRYVLAGSLILAVAVFITFMSIHF